MDCHQFFVPCAYFLIWIYIYRTLKPLALTGLEVGDIGRKNIRHLVAYLTGVLTTCQQYFVHMELVKQIFSQIYQFLDGLLFNEIVSHTKNARAPIR